MNFIVMFILFQDWIKLSSFCALDFYEAWAALKLATDLSEPFAEAATYEPPFKIAGAALHSEPLAEAITYSEPFLLAVWSWLTSLIPSDYYAVFWKVLLGLTSLELCLSKIACYTAFLFPKKSFILVNSYLPGI